MKRTLILFTILALTCVSLKSSAQTFAASTLFNYDNAGNRVLRYEKVICIDCPDGTDPPPGLVEETPIPEPFDTAVSKPVATSDKPKTDWVEIKVYPNPVTQVLFIENPNWKENDHAMIYLFDMHGKLIQTASATNLKEQILFNDLPPGTYTVQYILNNTHVEAWKILKQ